MLRVAPATRSQIIVQGSIIIFLFPNKFCVLLKQLKNYSGTKKFVLEQIWLWVYLLGQFRPNNIKSGVDDKSAAVWPPAAPVSHGINYSISQPTIWWLLIRRGLVILQTTMLICYVSRPTNLWDRVGFQFSPLLTVCLPSWIYRHPVGWICW